MENYRNLNCADIGDDAKILTLDRARVLKGKRVRWTYPAYRINVPDTRECVVGDIITEYELAERTPMKGYSSQAEWWEKYKTPDALQEVKDTMIILYSDGQPTWIRLHPDWNRFFDEPTFTCSDADRPVYFVEI